MSAVLPLLLQYLLPPLLTAAAGVGVALLGALTSWVRAKASSESAASVAVHVAHVASLIVQDLQLTMRPKVEEALKDGVLTDTEKAALKGEAIARVKTVLGTKGLEELQKALGVAGQGLEIYLSGLIESALAQVKADTTTDVAP